MKFGGYVLKWGEGHYQDRKPGQGSELEEEEKDGAKKQVLHKVNACCGGSYELSRCSMLTKMLSLTKVIDNISVVHFTFSFKV